MKISTKARYGLKAMCELALKQNQVLSIMQIAQSTNVSEAYLEQLMAILRKANLIVSVRGAGGGYTLARDAQDITIGEIIRVLEDDLKFTDCVGGECDNKCQCYEVWQKLYETINESLDKMKLSDICKGGQNE